MRPGLRVPGDHASSAVHTTVHPMITQTGDTQSVVTFSAVTLQSREAPPLAESGLSIVPDASYARWVGPSMGKHSRSAVGSANLHDSLAGGRTRRKRNAAQHRPIAWTNDSVEAFIAG